MKRTATEFLKRWQHKENRSPLILRGARQVGKTFIVEEFGQHYFDNVLKINFEEEPKAASFFEDLDPQLIIQSIGLSKKKSIVPGKTLLFLDEIQNCPQAIVSLRYFKEKLPALHVIAAGSLLEFALKNESISIPVGRVEFLYLKPLSFKEFLIAEGYEDLQQHLQTVSVNAPLASALHDELIKLVRQYFIIGGMPAAVAEYFRSKDWLECQRVQNNLLQTYQYDFGKYAPIAQHKYLQRLFDRIPYLICQTFKYVSVDPEFRSREIKSALQLLQDAGLIYQVYASSAVGLPLRAQINEKKFKLLFIDIGLAQRNLQMDSIILNASEMLTQINAGQLAEQFVGQELLAYHDECIEAHLHYWERDAKNSMAEVDYVIQVDHHVLPIEVKSGKSGRLKSLQLFMQEKKSRMGVKISQEPLNWQDNILTVPFYLIFEIPRLLSECLLL